MIINDKLFKVDTLGNYNGFLWKVIKLGQLKKGRYTLTVRNVKGFNAINVLVLISEKDYSEIKKEVEKLFQNKIIVYILKAEFDLHKVNAIMIRDRNTISGGSVLFIKDGKAWQEIEIVRNGTYRIALKGTGKFKINIGGKSFILRSSSLDLIYSPSFKLTKGKYRIEIIPLNVENLLKNPSFEEARRGIPISWKIGNAKDFKVSLDMGYNGKYSLKVSTTKAKPGTWSWIRSEPIRVKQGEEYLIITHIRVKNAKESHIVIEGWRGNKVIRQLSQCPPGIAGTGTYNWKKFVCKIKIPAGIDNIRIVLNAGWVRNKSMGEAVTWFDDIWIIPLNKAPKLDVIWIYSSNKTLDDLFEIREEEPAKIISFEKINPTLWIVKVNAMKPFVLTFAESYNSLWEARVYKDGKLVERVRSIPVYGVINGFWIDETGNLTIIIRYVPQDWFELGLKISATTFALCVFYLVWDWRRCRGDRWALWLERRVRSIPRELRGVVMRFLS